MKALYIAIGIALFYFLALPGLLGWYFAPENPVKSTPQSAFEEGFRNGGLKLEIRKMSCELEKPCSL